MQQLLDKWERLRKSEYLRPDEKLMLNHCISDLKRFIDHSGETTEMVGNRTHQMDKQQTAVQWFAFELSKYGLLPHGIPDVIYKKAKEMEKEQMIDFGAKCLQSQNETYGGNK